ncbi:SGNH/GDSL hydrolase family protein [Anabaena lutea]|uniref:Ig domain-containing protein n=1 Tax=Anabaena lutea FACHB-196 TaxID=2692881 RepID=A0ABR8FJZ0_9NOST|nr:SGNH/GDSL hydrolase family protein [Anabaena lutea]MBD2570303.1 putative Ig domain-containing protein [Anabaena lutea FACHB-196]
MNQSPILNNPILNQEAKANSQFRFTISNDIFSDPDAINPFDNLVVFGNSLSDTGNVFEIFKNFDPQPFGYPASPYYYQGRFANGPNWVDYLGSKLAFSEESVINFAHGGAKAGEDVVFPGFENNPIPSVLTQIQQFTTENTNTPVSEDTLYIIWAGHNDFNFLAATADPVEVAKNAATSIGDAITTLSSLGAKEIVVANLEDLKARPYINPANPTADGREFSIEFNNALSQEVNDLESSLNIDLSVVDIFSFNEEVQANPENYDFTNLTEPLIYITPGTVNPDEYAYWDEAHPTTKLHQYISQTFENTLLDEGIIPDLITYSTTLADGSELPDWLSFNPITQTFSGTPAYGDAGQLDVKVIATDKEGAIATDTFSIQIQTPFIFGTPNSEELNPEAGQTLFAGDGDDTINSTDDNDIFAGNGNDVVTVNSNSSVSAGDGDDMVTVGANGPANNTTVNGGDGEDMLFVAEANGTNNLFGAAGADELRVVEGSRQLLLGGSGNDNITSEGSNNRIFGGSGDDVLVSNLNDFLSGGDGNDILFAGKAGGNKLTGGSGNEQFWVANGSLPTSKNTITDFTIGVDKIGFGGVGILNFGQVTKEQTGADTLLKNGTTEIALLVGINSANLSASDFAFSASVV